MEAESFSENQANCMLWEDRKVAVTVRKPIIRGKMQTNTKGNQRFNSIFGKK
jgi:hypothetical protein